MRHPPQEGRNQEGGNESHIAGDRAPTRECRQPRSRQGMDEHSVRFHPRQKDDEDDDHVGGSQNRQGHRGQSWLTWGANKQCLGSGRDRDRSPRRVHADDYYRDGGHRQPAPRDSA